MQKKMKKGAVIFLISALVLFHFAAIAPAKEYLEDLDEKGGYMAGDLIVLRPLGIVATAVGAVIYVISLPFSLAGGNEEEARKDLDTAIEIFERLESLLELARALVLRGGEVDVERAKGIFDSCGVGIV